MMDAKLNTLLVFQMMRTKIGWKTRNVFFLPFTKASD